MAKELGKTGQGGASSEELDDFTTKEEQQEETQATDETTDETTEDETTETAEDDKATKETTEETSEDETTDETDETEETEDDPKDAVIGDYRRRARESERRNAELEGLLAAERARATAETTTEEAESPIDKYIEKHGDDVPLDGKTMREQKVFEARQAEKVAKKTAADESIANTRAGLTYARQNLSEAKVGKGLDFETIINDFSHHLDEGDRMMIERAGPKALIEARNRIITNVLNSGGEDAAILKSRIKAHNSKAKPKKKETTKLKTPRGEPVETDEDLRASTVHITNDLGMFD